LIVNGLVYSYGTEYASDKGDWGVSADSFLAAQSDKRETELLTLNLTPEQEAKLVQYLSTNIPNATEYSVVSKSCVTECEDALKAAGVLPNESAQNVAVDPDGAPMYGHSPDVLLPSVLRTQLQDAGKVQTSEKVGKKHSVGDSITGSIKSIFRKVFHR
jgi:hydroxymethylpyrimidine/phosphomethylpyrimidine kinase